MNMHIFLQIQTENWISNGTNELNMAIKNEGMNQEWYCKTHRKRQIHQIDIFLLHYIEKYWFACTRQ